MLDDWRVAVYSDLREVPVEDWDPHGGRPFHQGLDFLSVLARSGVEQADYRYLICYSAGIPAGSAILSRFKLHLDLLAGQSWLTRIKNRWAPGWLCAPMICCGIPASFGQSSVHAFVPAMWSRLIGEIHHQMQIWAMESGTGLLVWKEFPDDHPGVDLVRQAGYSILPTLPDHRFSALPAGVPAFMDSLRSAYRRKFRQVQDLLVTGVDGGHSGLRFLRQTFGQESVQVFYDGYRALMSRTPVKLEQYGPEFFQHLSEVRQFGLILLTLSEGADRVEALLADDGSDRYLLLVSKGKSFYEANVYEKLLRLIVLDAVKDRKKRLFLGQTSDYAKSALGAEPVRLVTGIRFLDPCRQKVFARCGHWLFPERERQSHRVFRASPQAHPSHV